MATSYPVLHACPVCARTAHPRITASAIDFICPACQEGEMVQVEFPERQPVLLSGRWGWIAGFCAGVVLLLVIEAGLGYRLGALGIVLLLVLISLFGEAALPQRALSIAGAERVLTRAQHESLAVLPAAAPES